MDKKIIYSSVEEECCYWKEAAKKFKQELADVREELDDFTLGSRELEAELEKMLDGKCMEINGFKSKCNRLEDENETLKAKLVSFENDNHHLETILATAEVEKAKFKKYVRELEQKNDDLERGHRIVVESVSSMEAMLNQAYEKNALLEMEMDEKEVLRTKMQRLMDETRDLKQELNVTRIVGNKDLGNLTNLKPDKDLLLGESSLHRNNEVPTIKESVIPNDVIRASSRVAALNLVADLLRKVNSMEAKLKACRTQMPTPSMRHSGDQIFNSSQPRDTHNFLGINDIAFNNKEGAL